MFLSSLEKDILAALWSGALDHFEIAADCVAAPPVVLDHLRRLKAARYVEMEWRPRARRWRLTPRGYTALHEAQQTVLGVDQ